MTHLAGRTQNKSPIQISVYHPFRVKEIFIGAFLFAVRCFRKTRTKNANDEITRKPFTFKKHSGNIHQGHATNLSTGSNNFRNSI